VFVMFVVLRLTGENELGRNRIGNVRDEKMQYDDENS